MPDVELELIAAPACAYVERCRIVLLEKAVTHSVTSIDLADPPAELRRRNPLGQVPVLVVRDGRDEVTMFESAVICEFLDEVSRDRGRLLPEDPVERAIVKAWTAHADACLRALEGWTAGADASHLQALLGAVAQKVETPFFMGDAFTLADAAYAPLLRRLALLESWGAGPFLHGTLREWHDALSRLPSVQQSGGADWEERVRGGLPRLLA